MSKQPIVSMSSDQLMTVKGGADSQSNQQQLKACQIWAMKDSRGSVELANENLGLCKREFVHQNWGSFEFPQD